MSARVIWKFPLAALGRNAVYMPVHSQILAVQMQAGVPTLWALVQPDADRETRRFETVGTGQPLSDDLDGHGYIGTIQQGPYVWHVFEVRR